MGVVAAFASALAQANMAEAAPDAETPGRSPSAMALAILGNDADAARVDESVREVAQRLGLTIATSGTLVARVTIDLRGTDVRIDVSDGAGAPIARRSVPRPASLEVLREEVALIVADALDAAIALARTPPPPPPAPPPTPGDTPPRDEPDKPRASGGPAARAEVFAFLAGRGRDANARVSLAAGLGARVAANGTGARPVATLSGDASLPYEAHPNGAELHVSPYAARLAPGVTTRLSGALELDATLGVGIDVLHVDARATGVNVVASEPTTRAYLVVAPVVALRVRLGGVRLTVGGGVDVDLTRRRYVVATPNGDVPALEPWPVRPVLTLGVALPVAGGGDED